MHCAKFRLVEASIGTCSFPYWHAFGVDDAAISHKQALARAKWCSRCGSLFLSANGSFLGIAEGGKKHNRKRAAKQAIQATHPEPNKIGASKPYDFEGRNLTPYGGLLPVATMLEKLGLQQLLEATITSKRVTRVMSLYKFALGIVLGFYVGFQRLNQLRFIARDPILTGVLGVDALPPQSTLWRFLAGLHLNVAGQILKIQQAFRQRGWEAADGELETGTLDTDTNGETVYGKQVGAGKSYNPKNKS